MCKRLLPHKLAAVYLTFLRPPLVNRNDSEEDCRNKSLEDRDTNEENCRGEPPNWGAVNAKVLRMDVEIVAAAANRHNDVFTILQVVQQYIVAAVGGISEAVGS